MTTTQPLTGCTLWLTRPAAQVQQLQQQLEQLGAHVLCLPMLLIEPVPLAGASKQHILDLDRYDLVFYVSSNAATLGLDAIHNFWPQYPAHLLNFAVGPGTAAVLERNGLHAVYPAGRMSSEAMLALPELQQIKGKQALIVRGVGGREILAESLQLRGASVDYAELYRRQRPDYDSQLLQRHFVEAPPQAVVISSAESLDNLRHFCATETLWQALPLFVSSERLAGHAHKLGNSRARVMAGASDTAIITTLLASLTPARS
jgi:uroporphyrinogen-III synthase